MQTGIINCHCHRAGEGYQQAYVFFTQWTIETLLRC